MLLVPLYLNSVYTKKVDIWYSVNVITFMLSQSNPIKRWTLYNYGLNIFKSRERKKRQTETYLAFQAKFVVWSRCLWWELRFVEFAWPRHLGSIYQRLLIQNVPKSLNVLPLENIWSFFVKRSSFLQQKMLVKSIPCDRSLVLQTQQQHLSP